MNILRLYIIITINPCYSYIYIYIYIHNILCWGLNNLIGLFICYFIGSNLKVFILVWYGIFSAHQLGTNTGNGIRFRNIWMSHLLFSTFDLSLGFTNGS